MSAIVKLEKVSKVYKGKHAVDNISLDIYSGSITALLGPNGAGKTTTISMLLGLISCTEGRVLLFNKHPREVTVREQIGAMLQEASILDGLKVAELIDLFRSYYPNPLSKDELLKLSGLEQEHRKQTSKLSGGQKRRLNFALALAGNPKLLFLDEPTAGMDIISRRLFWSTIRQFAERGATIVFTSHDLNEVEEFADRIVMLHRGKIIADGTPDEVKGQLTQSSVSFIVDDSDNTTNLLTSIRQLPGVHDVSLKESRIVITTIDTDQVIYALFNAAVKMRSIQITQGRLDDAFVELTKTQEEVLA